MVNVESITEVRRIIKEWRKQGLSVGFVPTMGYLHDGHKSLMEKAVAENDKTVVSIFVNPMQFGPNEDFNKYPRDLKSDLKMCENVGAELVFTPFADEIYPSENLVYIDVDELGDSLCGKSRPNHFRGVCTVVAKLFNIVTPDKAYFGQKDAQQLAIIKKMVQDLNFDVEIIPCPIIREPDGLALSSRNSYLSKEERNASLIISKSMKEAEKLILEGERNSGSIIEFIKDKINKEPLAHIDYVEVVDLELLKSVIKIDKPVLVAAAVYLGKTRLIDNFSFEEV